MMVIVTLEEVPQEVRKSLRSKKPSVVAIKFYPLEEGEGYTYTVKERRMLIILGTDRKIDLKYCRPSLDYAYNLALSQSEFM